MQDLYIDGYDYGHMYAYALYDVKLRPTVQG
jgi:hypothetical protein